ncbi:MAG: hypothetical protein WC765_04155 [Phycisphaerae bacterium]|jgi:hypothetical protein
MHKYCSLFAFAALIPANPMHAASEKLEVLKCEERVYIRSSFNSAQDLIIMVGKGVNRQVGFSRTFLVPRATAMAEAEIRQGTLIHDTGDDCTPWNLNGTYIGANHGSNSVLEVTSAEHGKTVADIGSEWVDELGVRFYLIKIASKDKLWFHSENRGTREQWVFVTKISGNSLKSKASELKLDSVVLTQLRPALRIREQSYLVDGKTPLPEGASVRCDFLDIVEENEIVNPATLVDDIIRHPGVEPNYVADHLPSVLRNHIVYRFYPNGSNVIEHSAKALQEFQLGYMGFIQSVKLTRGSFATHECYIPKTTPFEAGGKHYDFSGIQDFDPPVSVSLPLGPEQKNIGDPANLPDRFVQFLGMREGDRTVRKVGFAFGYSLIHGLTQPAERARNTNRAGFIYTSSKTYPSAVDARMGKTIPAGTEFRCLAYRQYFDPNQKGNSTCVYWHQEGDGYVVYADYHHPVQDGILHLPPCMTGGKFTVIEKTASVEVHSDPIVTEDGVKLSVAGEYGYLVLKVTGTIKQPAAASGPESIQP